MQISNNPQIQKNRAFVRNRNIFSEVDFRSSGIKSYQIGITNKDFKLVYNKTSEDYQLFDRKHDLEEKNNIFKAQEQVVINLKAVIAEQLRKHALVPAKAENSIKKQEQDLKPEEVEQLKTLGYM